MRLLSLAWLALAALASWSASGLGFPDGHLTELDRARSLALPAIAVVGVAGAALNAAFADRAPRLAAAAWGLTASLWAALEALLAATLDHGGGG